MRRLVTVAARTTALKDRLRSGGGNVFDVLRLPTPLARAAVRWMQHIAARAINLFVTDVPGPREPLALAGARMLSVVPVAPLTGNVPLGVAALSYAGTLHVAVNADSAVADLGVLVDGMEQEFTTLIAAARTGTPAPRRESRLSGRPGVVENEIETSHHPGAVFSYLSDPRNERSWNPRLRDVAKLTDGPIGVGTRFRMTFGSGIGDSRVEYVAYEPPHRWAATSTSRRLDVRSEFEVRPVGTGSRLVVRTLLLPHGPLRLLSPLLRRYMSRTWDRNLRAIDEALEHDVPREEPAWPGRSGRS